MPSPPLVSRNCRVSATTVGSKTSATVVLYRMDRIELTGLSIIGSRTACGSGYSATCAMVSDHNLKWAVVLGPSHPRYHSLCSVSVLVSRN